MDEKTKRELQELMERMNAVSIEVHEGMTLEQLRYFLKGYEYCYNRMQFVVREAYREFHIKPE